MSTSDEYGWKLWEAPPIWSGQTVVCVASGPSLNEEEIQYCYESGYKMIAVNDAYKMAPFADILYACDWWWWNQNDCVPDFNGVRVGLGWNFERQQPFSGWAASKEAKKINLIGSTGTEGLETKNRKGVRTGGNSGYQAINLAFHMGARNIFLLGYDMKPDENGKNHFFGEHQNRISPPYEQFIKNFNTIAEPLAKSKVRVINCNVNSALDMFDKVELEVD